MKVRVSRSVRGGRRTGRGVLQRVLLTSSTVRLVSYRLMAYCAGAPRTRPEGGDFIVRVCVRAACVRRGRASRRASKCPGHECANWGRARLSFVYLHVARWRPRVPIPDTYTVRVRDVYYDLPTALERYGPLELPSPAVCSTLSSLAFHRSNTPSDDWGGDEQRGLRYTTPAHSAGCSSVAVCTGQCSKPRQGQMPILRPAARPHPGLRLVHTCSVRPR